jgi:thiamine-monophosphate kinase
MNSMTLHDIGEKRLLLWLGKYFPGMERGVIVSNTHDAAVVRVSGNVAVKTDTMVITKSIPGISPEHIGYKAGVAVLSDFAAIGATPRYATLSISAPRKMIFSDFRSVCSGVRRSLARANVLCVGGDLSEASDLSVSISLVGKASQRSMTRSGSKAGDLIAVSRPFGLEPYGLKVLAERLPRGPLERAAVRRFLFPKPELTYGKLLSALDFVHACTDSSDGLLISIDNLLNRSLDASLEHLPASGALLKSGMDKETVTSLVSSGGEEYALVFSYDQRRDSELVRVLRKVGRRRIVVGRFVNGRGIVRDATRKSKPVGIRGWRQFES